MGLSNPFKLEKLKIQVYGDRERSNLQETIEVMFNPTTFTMQYGNVFQAPQGINTSGREAKYAHGQSQRLSLDLVIDGSGVTEFGLLNVLGLGADSVPDQIERFVTLCQRINGDSHQPNALRINWGEGPLSRFDCRLQSVSIKYTSFERSGTPLSADLTTVFVEDVPNEQRRRADGLNSPDVSHRREVRAGDTLPLLCKDVYGSPDYYLIVARANELDDFRNLVPGQEILFPRLPGASRNSA